MLWLAAARARFCVGGGLDPLEFLQWEPPDTTETLYTHWVHCVHCLSLLYDCSTLPTTPLRYYIYDI